MAQLDENSVLKPVDFDDNIDDDEESSPWEDLLNEAKQSSSKLQEHKNVILLGDVSSGKTTLIAKLQGNEEPEKGSGLEFTHLTVSDEYREDTTNLGVWVVDGDPTHTGLLKYALTVDNFQDCVIVITVSMSQPWFMVKSLSNWLNIVSDHIDRLGLNQDTLHQCQQKLVRQFQQYVEPDSNTSSRLSAPPTGGSGNTEDVADAATSLPLGETVLVENLGIPVIVVVTKSDAISTLEKDMDYKEEKFDFIQQHIRKICLKYGAALFYTSVREEKNCDLLFKYISHRIYGLEFTSPPLVVDRDSVFIPCGWDSEKKISILGENLMSIKPDDEFDSIMKRPAALRRPANRDGEVSADDEQDLMARCNALLAKGAPAAATVKVEGGPQPNAAGRSPNRQRVGTPPNSSTPSPKKGSEATKAGAQQGETVLANFFNSLLTKKTGTPTRASPDSNAARAELDRMTRNSKSSSSS